MATATKTKTSPGLDVATEELTELNERLLDTGKKIGNLYLDAYETTVAGVSAAQRKLAEQAPIDVVRAVVEAQADLTDKLAKTYTTAAREVLA